MNAIPDDVLNAAKHAAASEATQWAEAKHLGDPSFIECVAAAAVRGAMQVLGARNISQDAEILHAEHHPGTFVPSLDSCSVHERSDYEQIVRDMNERTGTS